VASERDELLQGDPPVATTGRYDVGRQGDGDRDLEERT
jgi:hypothetical protein